MSDSHVTEAGTSIHHRSYGRALLMGFAACFLWFALAGLLRVLRASDELKPYVEAFSLVVSLLPPLLTLGLIAFVFTVLDHSSLFRKKSEGDRICLVLL